MKLSINQQTINLMGCTSKDTARQVLTWVWYDSKGKRFVACNGHIANIIPYTAPADDPDNFQYPEKDVYIKFPRVTLKAAAILDTETGILTPLTAKQKPVVCEMSNAEKDGVYPEIDKVLPTSERVYRIGIDAKLLCDLAKSIEPDGRLELAFPTDGRSAIEVSNIFTSQRQGRAIIMPLRICDCENSRDYIGGGLSPEYIERVKAEAVQKYEKSMEAVEA